MHSSRMRLTGLGGGGACATQIDAPPDATQMDAPFPGGQTCTCKNITFPQLRLRAVKIINMAVPAYY